MAITTNDQYVAAAKQDIQLIKTGNIAVTQPATGWWSCFAAAGNPGAGTIATLGAATTGSVPNDTVAGFPSINAFGVSAKGYITGVEFSNTIACRMAIDDVLWSSASVSLAAAATTSFSGNPSYSSRLSPANDYTGTRLFMAINTAVTTTSPVVIVTYTNQAGTAGRTTGSVTLPAVGSLLVGRLVELPLQAGDSGIQSIQSIQVVTPGAAGACNLWVVRNVWTGRVKIVNDGGVQNLYDVGIPEIFTDSALALRIITDTAVNTGLPEVMLQISNA